jgi:uncharacterized protein (TIGR00730 family)
MQRICVYCGSSLGSFPLYANTAEELGKLLVKHNYELVYGGGAAGTMGAVADAVMLAGGTVYGIIPEGLFGREVVHRGITHLEVVDSMHSRKARMAELADAFITLPGGIGTLEELFETLSWAQLGIHQKPVGLLNLNGFYDELLRFLDYVVKQGFIRPVHRNLLIVESDPEKLLERLNEFRPPLVSKWLGEKEI